MTMCKRCKKQTPDSDLWDLKFIGSFCTKCALYVTAYWSINADPVIQKIEASIKEDYESFHADSHADYIVLPKKKGAPK